jgi:hypothetical protein
MLLLAAVVASAFLSGCIGLTLWRRSPWGGERVLAAGLLALAAVFAWIATTPHVGGMDRPLLATAPATAGPPVAR